MKKLITIIIFLFVLNLTYGQDIHTKIKGHWNYCDKEQGYSELFISDTLIYHISRNSGLSAPLEYNFKKNYALIKYSSDTIFFNSITKNKVVITSLNKQRDTLSRLKEKASPVNRKIDCSLEMNPRQYSSYLETEFEVRRIKNELKCISPIYEKFKEKIHPISDEELGMLKIDTSKPNVFIDYLDYQIIKEDTKSNKTKLIEIIVNPEIENKALVVIDYWGFCYNNFRSSATIDDDNYLNLNVNQFEEPCDKECHLRLYFELHLLNYKIKGIKFNKEKLK